MKAINLINKRKQCKMSQRQLATLSHVSIKTIQAYEQGRKDINKAESLSLFKMAQVLDCEMEDLLENKNFVVEKAYAKINLDLKVVGKENGYHNLVTIMAPIGLYDTLFFEESNELQVLGIDIIDNSIYQAAQLFIKTYHTPPCKITVIKRIPIEAGLGGGSADSSAVLRGMNRLYGLGRSLKELETLANQLGSDNAYCLYNELAICRGRGNVLEIVKKSFSYHILLIKPSFGLKTKDVFEKVEINSNKCHTTNLINGICDLQYLDANIQNDLFSAALKINNQLCYLNNKIKKFGFIPHMTGSGSCLFVLSEDYAKLKTLSSHFSDCFVKITLINNCF